MIVVNGETRVTLSEAKTCIASVAKNVLATVTPNGLGCRREGVPGTGGGTFAMSFYRKYPNNKYAYVSVAYC